MKTVFIAALLLFAGGTGAGIVWTPTPWRLPFAIAAHGLVLSLLFVALGAPDVAFSELAVGTAALPLLFLVVLSTIRINRTPPHPGPEAP